MRKLVDIFSKYFPHYAIGWLVLDAILTWDIERVMINVIGIIGWLSFIELRSDYNRLEVFIEDNKYDA